MRKIVLYMFTTLDGFIAGPNGEFDDYEPSVEESKFANAFFSSADGILFGRITYEGFVSYWDSLDLTDESISTTDIEFAKIFRKLTRVVISRTLDTVGANTILIKDNVAAEVLRVKQQPGGYLVLICGPELLSTLVLHFVHFVMTALAPSLRNGQSGVEYVKSAFQADFTYFPSVENKAQSCG
jgi:dihydrofolate reductase